MVANCPIKYHGVIQPMDFDQTFGKHDTRILNVL